jgi:predicted alpha/beta-fold hydrolase
VSPEDRAEIYRPAWWIPGAHAQTLWGKFFRPRPPLPLRVERWDTPDGDFVDVHRLEGPRDAPRLLFLHGLEGTIRSHYVAGFFGEAKRRGWAADLLIFRGCGDEPNRAPRFYHSGETGDLAMAVGRVHEEQPDAPIVLAGVSLGGNVLLKFLGEQAAAILDRVVAAAAVSVPFDLERGARFISTGFSRVYDRHFLRTLREKALAKLERYPGLFDADDLNRATNIYEFDDAVTAPVHGFKDAHDYYARSSSLGFLGRITVPTLLLSAVDDPFLPADVLEQVRDVARTNPRLQLEFTEHGGHVGFIGGRLPWRPFYYAEWRACEFLSAALERRGRAGAPVTFRSSTNTLDRTPSR